MTMLTRCTNRSCLQTHHVSQDDVGRDFHCSACGTTFRVNAVESEKNSKLPFLTSVAASLLAMIGLAFSGWNWTISRRLNTQLAQEKETRQVTERKILELKTQEENYSRDAHELETQLRAFQQSSEANQSKLNSLQERVQVILSERDELRKQTESLPVQPKNVAAVPKRDVNAEHMKRLLDPASDYAERLAFVTSLLKENKHDLAKSYLNVVPKKGSWEWDFLNYWCGDKNFPVVTANDGVDGIPLAEYGNGCHVFRKGTTVYSTFMSHSTPITIGLKFEKDLGVYRALRLQVVNNEVLVDSTNERARITINSPPFKIKQIVGTQDEFAVLSTTSSGRATLRIYNYYTSSEDKFKLAPRLVKNIELTKEAHGLDLTRVRLANYDLQWFLCTDGTNPALKIRYMGEVSKCHSSFADHHLVRGFKKMKFVFLSDGQLIACNVDGDAARELNPKVGNQLKSILTTATDRILIQDKTDNLLVVDADTGDVVLKLDAKLQRLLPNGQPDPRSPTIGQLSGEAIRTNGGEFYLPDNKCFVLPVVARRIEQDGGRRRP